VRDPAVIRQLIFDLDGTLVDSCSTCVQILSGMLEDRGSDHRIDATSARPWMSVGGGQMVAALLGPACEDPHQDIAEFRARYRETMTPPDALFPGVVEGLSQLYDDGFALSICSNKPQELCDQVLRDTGIRDLFQVVVGLRPGLRAKPEVDLLHEVLTVQRCSPGECLFIGDSEIDHQVAERVGIPFVFMSYGYAVPVYEPEEKASFDCFRTMAQDISRQALAARAA
jgi:phosphoglycolate phosphatase